VRGTALAEKKLALACGTVRSERPSFNPLKPNRSFAIFRFWPEAVYGRVRSGRLQPPLSSRSLTERARLIADARAGAQSMLSEIPFSA